MIVLDADFALKGPEAGWVKNSRLFVLSIKKPFVSPRYWLWGIF